MRRFVVLFLMLLLVVSAGAQVTKIIIPAGTPEDRALASISNEQSPEKRAAMLQEFVQNFAENPQAVAYGNWQLSQQYLSQGDTEKALAYGEKALAAQPNNLDILMSVITVAEQTKQADKIVDCAVRGGNAFNGIAKQPKPADLSDSEWAERIKQDQDASRASYEYMEAAGYNTIVAAKNPKVKMGYIESFIPAFPESRFAVPLMQLGVFTAGQLNDPARLNSFADKVVAGNPNSASTYMLLASAFAEGPNAADLPKAERYAQKAIELGKADAAGADKQRKLWAGMAHSALGYALLRQEKTPAAIAEFRTASTVLKEDADAYSTVLYRLGFAYAKIGKLAEAKAVLSEAVQIKGPAQELSRELLGTVEAAAAKRKK